MNLQQRIDISVAAGEYISTNYENQIDPDWQAVKEKAFWENGWFTHEFIDRASINIADKFLQKDILTNWAIENKIPGHNANPQKVGIVMAGNIPMVGFHDLLCTFISGHKAVIKTSSKDNALIRYLVEKMISINNDVAEYIQFEDMLKGCDAYIATGSNNSSRYFEYYFGKYPNIIRKNRTSVAILSGKEALENLEKLADDVHLYFGLGCRNVTKIFVPENYDFVPLLDAFKKYNHFSDHHKYKNNYDYNLAIHILNNSFYMTNGSIILKEDKSIFSPISQLNYQFYTNKENVLAELKGNTDLQCIAGDGFIPYGQAQSPGIGEYADGVNTMKFLLSL